MYTILIYTLLNIYFQNVSIFYYFYHVFNYINFIIIIIIIIVVLNSSKL